MDVRHGGHDVAMDTVGGAFGMCSQLCAGTRSAEAACYPGLGDCTDPNRPSPAPLPTQSPAPPAMTAPSPGITIFDMISQGQWATGGPGNCGNPRKLYSLALGKSTITWRDGAGNVDVETIEFNTDGEARTETVSSSHMDGRGEKRGTVWSIIRQVPTACGCSPRAKTNLASSNVINQTRSAARDGAGGFLRAVQSMSCGDQEC